MRLSWLPAGRCGDPWWGGREEEVGTPLGWRVPRGLAAPSGVGGFARASWLSPPARAEAGEQQAGASGFPVLIAQGPGPAAGEGRVWNRGFGAGEWGEGASRPLP